jgi:tetratricopeptide (TPR) repeat protein
MLNPMRYPDEPAVPDVRRLIVLVDGRRPDLAEREVRAALRQHPGQAALHGLLALALVKQQRDQQALDAAREALRLDPYHPWANQAWAAVHALLPRYQRKRGSITAVRQAVQRSPGEPALHAYLALAILTRALARRRARRLCHEALEAAESGLALDPLHLDCHLVAAQALVALGRTGEARQAALRALEVAPEQSAPHAVLGIVEVAARNAGQGHRLLREALRIDPNNRFAEEKLGVASENQRWAVAMEQQLRAWTWPMRLVRALGLVGTAFGMVAGSIFCAVMGPAYVLLLHPAFWRRVSRPESRELLGAPGALRRADVLTARGTIAFCVAAVAVIFTLCVWG